MPAYRYHEDSRDGKVYKCVLMPDGKWWSAVDLAWDSGYYKHEDAQSAIPNGCHGPTQGEWNLLNSASGGGQYLKSAGGWAGFNGLDTYGFALSPTGYVDGVLRSSDRSYHVVFPYVSGCFRIVMSADPFSYAVGYGYSGNDQPNLYKIRFIVDAFNTPSNFKLFGCNFQGFDRDATVTITRQIQVQESEGGSVTLIPTAPAQFDSWDIEVGLRVSAAQAQEIEASLPPYGTPIENALRLPPRGGGASFPGLLPLTPGETYDLYAYPMASPLDVQGRVAIGTDLFSYRMSLRFFAAHRVGVSAPPTNTPTATTTTAPEWLTGKAITHSVVDPSTSIPTISRFGASTAVSTNFHPTKQGRTNKRTITLDCLSQDRADELVGFFRGVRHNPTTITLDNGVSGFEAVSVYLTALSFTRGDGLYWTGSLEVVLA